MTTISTARPKATPAAKTPTPYQRKKMFEALTEDNYRIPGDTDGRSLDLMLEENWILEYAANGRTAAMARALGYDGFTHFRLTRKGRMALLIDRKRTALESAAPTGRIADGTARPVLRSLEADGLIAYVTDHGQVVKDPTTPYITNLGRRLLGRPAVNETPAAASLIAEFAQWGITTTVETNENGDTAVVYRDGSIRAEFYRPLTSRGFSATHPAWMHNSSWYGWIDDAGDYRELIIPEGLPLPEENARTAEAFAEWLSAPQTADVPAGGAAS
ncbi:hypothetical protein [Streptomyces sp. NPDC085665]|uniref:hypothetical protein n=1 Tax=Streptomyces sp. NPDC085665 TaxID=3365735 RepID=UPI0037D0531A